MKKKVVRPGCNEVDGEVGPYDPWKYKDTISFASDTVDKEKLNFTISKEELEKYKEKEKNKMKDIKERTYPKIPSLFLFDSEDNKYWSNIFSKREFDLLRDNKWIFTEKVDGTNFRIIWDGYNLTYGGRTLRAQFSKKQTEYIENYLVTKEKETIIEQLFGEKELVIYGEVHGGDIQSKANYSEEYQFRVFDIWVDGYWLEYDNIVDVATKLKYKVVPELLVGTIDEGIDFVKNTNKSEISDTGVFEGLIGKPLGDFLDKRGDRIIVKIKKEHFKKMKE